MPNAGVDNALIAASVVINIGQLVANAELAEVPPGTGPTENARDHRFWGRRGGSTNHVRMFDQVKSALRRHID
jgi:hypothetical protein